MGISRPRPTTDSNAGTGANFDYEVNGSASAVCRPSSGRVLIHATGTVVMARAIKVRAAPTTRARFFRPLLDLAVGFLFVFFLHVLEVLVWAGAYITLGAIASLEEAIYFSIVSFTTVGYGDVVLPRNWRILGPPRQQLGS